MSGDGQPVHATLVAWPGLYGWAGVLIRGPSGAGKSTLALEALETGARLVADDRVQLWRSGAAVYGRAPAPLWGLIEVRGVGVLPHPAVLPTARIALVADLDAPAERLPDPESVELLGMATPRIRIQRGAPAPALRLRAALAAVQRRL